MARINRYIIHRENDDIGDFEIELPVNYSEDEARRALKKHSEKNPQYKWYLNVDDNS